MTDVPLHRLYRHYSELPYSQRVLYTATLLVLAITLHNIPEGLAIGVAFGAVVGRAPELLHGRTSRILHEGRGVLAGLPSPFAALPGRPFSPIRAAFPGLRS